MPRPSSNSTRGITSDHLFGSLSRQRSGGSLTWLSVSMTGMRSAIAVMCRILALAPVLVAGRRPTNADSSDERSVGQRGYGLCLVEEPRPVERRGPVYGIARRPIGAPRQEQ